MTAPTETRAARPPAYDAGTVGAPRRGRHISAAIAAAILSLVLGGYIAVGVALVKAAYDPMAGRPLTYDALQRELDSALTLRTAFSLRAGLAAVEDSVIIDGRTGPILVRWDSLAVLDTTVNPALRPHGFLADEVRRYNDAQRGRLRELEDAESIRGGAQGRAALGAASGRPAFTAASGRPFFVAQRRPAFSGRIGRPVLIDLRERHNPSVFRSRLMFTVDSAEMGERIVLSPRAVTAGMRVPSPFETRREVLITTKEAPERFALLGARSAVLLHGSGVTPGVAGCPFSTRGDSINIQCRMPGSARREVLVAAREQSGTSTLTVAGQYPVHYDGERVTPGRTVAMASGGLLQLPSRIIGRAPGAMALERTAVGTLAGTQWVNGRTVWRHSPDWSTPFARHLVGPSGFGATSAQASGRIIPLSLDESLLRDVQRNLEQFTAGRRSVADLGFALAVIAHARTGEILAVAELGESGPDAPSRVLQAFNIGSAIKPLLTVAALAELPELGTLEIWNPGGTVNELWGHSFDRGFDVGGACPVGWIDLRRFLSCSSNLYSASLVAAALQSRDVPRPEFENGGSAPFRLAGVTRNGRRPRMPLDARGAIDPDTLNRSALSFGLDSLFGIATGIEAAIADLGRDSAAWRGLAYHGGGAASAPFGLWPEQSRVGLVLQGQRASLRQLVSVALGAGEVRITPIHLTQAFGRIVTDRRLVLTFVPSRDTLFAFDSLGLARSPWYAAVRGGLRDVGESGTGAGLAAAGRRILGPDIVFYGKTGTLNTRPAVIRRRVVDTLVVDDVRTVITGIRTDTIAPVAVKSLVFALGKPGPARGAALECGVVGTLYFRFGGDSRAVDDVARAFAEERLWRVLRAHWDRLELC
ncbi:MAG TPA: hypothetical protein VMM18_05460 [Gemmatimonadaceae bacterium]|nr:hypothetical protein [Gemmatimonadaceae bacterium]